MVAAAVTAPNPDRVHGPGHASYDHHGPKGWASRGAERRLAVPSRDVSNARATITTSHVQRPQRQQICCQEVW